MRVKILKHSFWLWLCGFKIEMKMLNLNKEYSTVIARLYHGGLKRKVRNQQPKKDIHYNLCKSEWNNLSGNESEWYQTSQSLAECNLCTSGIRVVGHLCFKGIAVHRVRKVTVKTAGLIFKVTCITDFTSSVWLVRWLGIYFLAQYIEQREFPPVSNWSASCCPKYCTCSWWR